MTKYKSQEDLMIEYTEIYQNLKVNKLEKEILDLSSKTHPMSEEYEQNPIKRQMLADKIPLLKQERKALLELNRQQLVTLKINLYKAGQGISTNKTQSQESEKPSSS